MKAPFRYYGGKRKLAPKIIDLMPPHIVYAEPYCGSAAVAFAKGFPNISNNRHYREFLNDKNDLIVNFFRVLQAPSLRDELIDRLEYTLHSKKEYDLAINVLRSKSSTANDRAWAWFIVVNWSFSSKINGGFGISLKGENQALSHTNKVSALKWIRSRLDRTTIMDSDAIKLIERLDSPQTLFYADPPYPGTNQGHYGGFTQSDFEVLIDTLKACKGAVLLSCYDNPAVPSEWEKHTFHAIASSNGITGPARQSSGVPSRPNAKRIECVWFKPASTPLHSDLQHIAERNIEMIRSGNVV